MTEKRMRSSVALGAAAALVVSGFATAPSYGAETLTLAPSAGTLYTSVTTSEFEVSAGFAGTESTAATGTLKYRVVNSDTTTLTVDTVEGGAETDATAVVDTGTSDDALDSGTQNTSADDFVVDPTGTPEIGAEQSLQLLPTVHTSDVSVTVQAFLDLDNDNEIDSNEPTSPVRTITWYDQANISLGSITYDGVTLGSPDFDVVVTTDPALNYQQVASGDFDVQATLAGTDDTEGIDPVAYNPTEKDFRASVSLGEDVGAVKAVGVQLELADGSGNNPDIGSPVYYGVVETGDASAVTDVTAVAGDDVDGSNNLRAGSGSVTVIADVTVGATDSKVQPVTFVLEENGNDSLDSDATLTMNGETLKNTSSSSKQKISVTVNSAELTETKGRASITISYSDLDGSDAVDVRAVVESSTDTITSSGDLTLTGADSKVTALVDNVTGAARVVKGRSMSIAYTVVDQFGQTPAAAEGEFRIVVEEDSTDANFTGTIAVTNGTATFTTTENSTANNNYTVTGTLEEKPVGASSFSGISGGAITEETTVAAVSSQTAGSITASADDDGGSTNTDAVALDLEDQQSTADSEIAQSSIDFASYTNGTNVTGTVSSTTGAPLAGAPVTLSASGLQFVYSKADSGEVYGADSITVTADTDGTYSVLVSSNQAGVQTVTVSSGGATKTEDIRFKAAASDTASSWSLTAPETAESGSTFEVTATLTDKYGNPVAVASGDTEKILTSYSGPGIVFGDLPSTTDADGQFSFSVLLGANDTGSATITAGYSLDDDGNTSDYGEFAASTSVTVGAEDTFTGTYGTQKAWTVNQGDGTAKVYVKFPEVGGKLRILHQTGGSGDYASIYALTTTSEDMEGLRQVAGVGTYVVRTIDLADGTNRIRVSVDGEDIEVNDKDRPVRYNE